MVKSFVPLKMPTFSGLPNALPPEGAAGTTVTLDGSQSGRSATDCDIEAPASEKACAWRPEKENSGENLASTLRKR